MGDEEIHRDLSGLILGPDLSPCPDSEKEVMDQYQDHDPDLDPYLDIDPDHDLDHDHDLEKDKDLDHDLDLD